MPGKPNTTRVTLFLDPMVAEEFRILAVKLHKDRSTLVTEWVRYVASQTAAATQHAGHSHQED